MKIPFRLSAAALALAFTAGCAAAPASSSVSSSSEPASQPAATPQAEPAEEIRAMWISYKEWETMDFSSEAAFTEQAAQLMTDSAELGMNRVLVQVRPFADAIYPSELFPWSDLCTGTQGQDPGYDPLAILVEQAHSAGLAIEAWVNPYRVRLNASYPAGELAADNPAVLHPDWAKEVNGGIYLDPANPDVQAYIADGVQEILDNYAVDGIHFDDYFYPTTEESFDEAEYAASGTDLSLADWRRENVNSLVSLVYRTVKESSPTAVFGISPQGNPDNNYNGQYSDVGLWMSTPGYLDYVMPQIYWGFGYTLKSGSDRFAFENIVAEWAAMPRADSVALCAGLGAYRIGDGDGGSNENSTSQWQTGCNLASQVEGLRGAGLDGYALYRYASLFDNAAWSDLAAQECEALRQVNETQA
ncbi:family 10 glycosylhydrolase [Gemmiger formicilis]|uniref:glycoside hydrolase family 10 protein n=1 Tax=Gemmiger formicilis TaxID=745368 RepID=UPI0019566937|nr:family 10 glycosylhydrolase [Gemmiger formicilis]MBM6913823.1 family 10 glycosylhydrolase [Gemmiger formicilis]